MTTGIAGETWERKWRKRHEKGNGGRDMRREIVGEK